MARRWVIAAMAVPVVLIGAAVAAALLFDPNGQKQRIVTAVGRATGRTLTLAGPLHITWGLAPVLSAEDASFANAPGGTRPQMATVHRVEARVRLLPLLAGRVEIARVALVSPDILLETDKAGRGNWLFDHPAPSGPAAPSVQGRRAAVIPESVAIEGGTLTWHDGVTGRTSTATVSHATLDAGAGPVHVVGALLVEGVAVKLDATLGTAAQLAGSQPGPFPVQVHAAIGAATVALDGTLDPGLRAVSGRLEATVPDVQQAAAALQQPPMPPLHDVHLAATLPPGGGMPQDVALTIGASDLSSLLPGAALNHLALAWPAGQPARLDADGTLGGAAWRLGSGLAPAGQGVALRGLTFTSGLGDVAGDIAVMLLPRPALRGTLVSSRVDLDAIRALRPPVAAAAPVPPALPAPPASAPGWVIPDTPLPWQGLRRADADLQLSIGALRAGGGDYRNATGHLVLADGVLHLDPASVQSPAGRVDFSLGADATAPAPLAAITVRAAALAIDPLLGVFGLPRGSDASLEVDVALHAAGSSLHALVSTLDGHVGLATVDGQLANAVLVTLLGDLLRSAGARLDPGGVNRVRCLAIRADARAGQVTLTTLKLDTAPLSLDGSGTLNLADETLALRLRPLVRAAGVGVSAPVRLDGTLRHPVFALDPATGTGRVGVTFGALGGAADTCAPELASARDGRSGRLPTEVAAAPKPPKPADLLRGLLR